MRPIVKGFPATSQDDYQLNVTNILKQAAASFGKINKKVIRQEYKDIYTG